MNPISTSTTAAGVLTDMGDLFLRSQQAIGAAAPAIGVTRVAGLVKTAADLTGRMRQWNEHQTLSYGGRGMDDKQSKVEDGYAERRYQFLYGEEAGRERAYDDVTGQPVRPGVPKKGNITIGIGFNMDRPGAQRTLEAAIGAKAQRFQDLYTGKSALTAVETRKLFEWTAEEAESHVTRALPDVPLPEHQRLALVSMAFNSPKLLGPKIVDAIKNADVKGAVNEILHNSNARGIRGLASRRWREATTFLGHATERSKWGVPDFDVYMKGFTK